MRDFDSQSAKEFLKGYQNALKRLETIRLQIDELRASQLGGAIKYSDMPKAHNITDLSDYAAKYDELLRRFVGEKTEAICKMELIHQVISTLSDQDEQRLLVLKYIKNTSWDDIPDMMNISRATMHRMHSRALQKIKNLIPEKIETV